MGCKKGFSLLEVMAALAIMAICLVVAVPSMGNMLASLSFRKEVNQVMAQVRGWKLLAISKGRPIRVTVEEHHFLVRLSPEEQQVAEFKEDVEISMEPAQITFSPEGWATPTTLVVRSNTRSRTLWIDPLTSQPRKL